MRKQYLPSPVDTGDVQLPDYLECLTEKMARNVHEVWAEGRMKEGWRYGPVRDDAAGHFHIFVRGPGQKACHFSVRCPVAEHGKRVFWRKRTEDQPVGFQPDGSFMLHE